MNAVEGTKHKILVTALELFASNGYAATSVREIATHADVNVSAFNYHFESKQGLYAAVINKSKFDLKNYIRNLYISKDNWQVVDFVSELSDLFHQHRVHITATFKVLLNNVEVTSETILSEDNPSGTPGVEYLIELIKLMTDIKDEETIFKIAYITMTHLIHKTVCLHSFEEKCLDLPEEHMSWDYSKELNLFLISKLLKN